MSAWICTDNHLNYLLSFMATREEADKWLNTRRYSGKGQLDVLANKLRAANYASCNARYRDEYGEAPQTGFQFYPNPLEREYDPVTVLKLCACFDYQACEVPDYEESEAAKIINAIRFEAIRALPGYEAAPWGID